VIYNKASEEPLLPQPPPVSTGMGAEPTAEVPKPFHSGRGKQEARVAGAVKTVVKTTTTAPQKESTRNAKLA